MKNTLLLILLTLLCCTGYAQDSTVIVTTPVVKLKEQAARPLGQLFMRRLGAKTLSNTLSFDGGDGFVKSNFDANVLQPSASLNFGDFIQKKQTSNPSNILRGYLRVGFTNSLTELFKNFSKNVFGELYFTYATPIFSGCKLTYFAKDKGFNDQLEEYRKLEVRYGLTQDEAERDNIFQQFDSLAIGLRYNSQKYTWFAMTFNNKVGQEDEITETPTELFKINRLDFRTAVKLSFNYIHIINDNRGFGEFQWGGNQMIKPYVNIGFTNRSLTALHKSFSITDTAGNETKLFGIEQGKLSSIDFLCIPGISFEMLGIKSKFGIVANFEVQNTVGLLGSHSAATIIAFDAGFNMSLTSLFEKFPNNGSRENLYIGFRYVKGLLADRTFNSISPQIRFETPLDFNRKRSTN